jgi:mRNA interferase HigB
MKITRRALTEHSKRWDSSAIIHGLGLGLFPLWERCYNEAMRLIARNVLLAYAHAHPHTAVPLERWCRLVKASNWTSMDDIRRAAPTAKVLNRERTRFEVAGGNYRLIAAFDFRRQIVFVKFIGTHAEYDAVDALTVARF